MSRPLILVALALVGSAPLLAAPAFAQPSETEAADSYRAHMSNGVKLFKDQNYDAAIAEFRAAYRAEPKANPLINIALSQKALFRYVAAIKTLEQAIAQHPDSMNTSDRAAAEKAIEEMRGLLAYVTISVNPSSAQVSIDGEAVVTESMGHPLPVGPGKHTIVAEAEGYATQQQTLTIASGEQRDDIQFNLVANQGLLKVTTGDPEMYIAVDRKMVGKDSWMGVLPPGTHLVQMYKPDSAQYDVEVDLIAGKTTDISPGKGGRPVTPRPMPEVPPPPGGEPVLPRAERRSDQGFYALATLGTLFPVTHPFSQTSIEFGGAFGFRAGYRVTSFAAFDFMVEFEDVGVDSKFKDGGAEDEVSYSLVSWRLGPTFRLMTPTDVFRGFGTLGGGLAYDDLSFQGPSDLSNHCVNQTTLCRNGSGFDPFLLVEVGAELDLEGVLIGVALQSVIHSSKAIDPGDERNSPYDDDPVVQLGPSLRVGYAFW